MTIALQLIINILIPTALYGLVAAGFSVFYAVSRVQHMAIGASTTGAGYAFFALLKSGFSLPLAIFTALVVAAIIGLVCNALVYERLISRQRFSSLVAIAGSIMLLLIGQSILLMIFGSQPKSAPLALAQTRFEVLGASVTLNQLISVPLALALLLVFFLYLKYSRVGVAIRATSDNPEVAEIVGINTQQVRYYTMLLISLLAGVAGILLALEFNLEPYASNMHAIRGFARTIVGGIGSVPGVLFSGLLMDGAEHIGGFLLNSSYKELYSFVIVFLFLLFRPQGLLGAKRD